MNPLKKLLCWILGHKFENFVWEDPYGIHVVNLRICNKCGLKEILDNNKGLK